MKKISVALLLLIITKSLFAQKNIYKELCKQERLPNLAQQLSNGSLSDTLKIAYLGGSITEQKNGWRDQSFKWFQSKYPNKIFKQTKAAIGGTGSLLGVFRFDEQVLTLNPNLIFIEFAVNDLKESRESILENFDGIIQKTWRANPSIDICIVFTFNEEMLKNYNKGKLPPSIKAMAEIADWYKIPTINFGVSILEMLKAKKLFIKGSQPVLSDSTFFSSDGVHPFPETGHVLYTKTLTNFLPRLLAKNKKLSHHSPIYFSDKLINAGFVYVEDFVVGQNKSNLNLMKFEDRITSLATNIAVLEDTSQSLEFQFTGSRIGFMDVIGPSSAAIDVYIDDQALRHVERFDSYCTYNRIHWFFIEGLADTAHHIKIKLSANQPDKFKILDSTNRGMQNESSYHIFAWSVSKILASNVNTVKR